MSGQAAPSLKCIIAWSDRRNLCSLIEQALEGYFDAADFLRLDDEAYLVYTDQRAPVIRDSIAPVLDEGESALVVEFERWSGLGPGVHKGWLLRRGH